VYDLPSVELRVELLQERQVQTASFDYQSRRSTVYGTRGMVASRYVRLVDTRSLWITWRSSQPLATQAGLDILKQGGNAAVSSIVEMIMAGR
jgi:gamma-glutamyltranspeptidase